MAEIQRFTTEYIDSEDRIRLTGESAQGEVVVLWLTQRLLGRLLSHLLRWLERHDGEAWAAQEMGHVVQGFAQQSAMAALQPDAPVKSACQSRALLVQVVNLDFSSQGVRLVWGGGTVKPEWLEGMTMELNLDAWTLRQWLGILHGQYRKAGWPMENWPDWVSEGTGSPDAVVRMH